MADVKIKVKSTAARYDVWIDGEVVTFVQDAGTKTLPAGNHLLSWFAVGASGAKVDITVSAGGDELATVPGKIPASYGHAGGVKRFKVGA